MHVKEITSAVFDLGQHVRYVAIANGQDVTTQQRAELSLASASESDRFEELLVNPALLMLTTQRGEIDCGGLRYIIVRYGHFFQVVVPRPEGGHVSVAVEPDADPVPVGEAVIELLDRHM
jgi:hypothetical protein